jgi:adenylate cyclase
MSQSQVKDTLAVAFIKINREVNALKKIDPNSALALINDCLDVIRNTVVEKNGVVIKTLMHDNVMCTFSSADVAMSASIAIQEKFKEGQLVRRMKKQGVRIPVKLGFSYGEVLTEDGDVFGHTVNVAARITGDAKTGQILTDKVSVDTLSPELQLSTRLVDHMPAKGISEPIEIYEVIWDEDGHTYMATSVVSTVTSTVKKEVYLLLNYNGQSLTLDNSSEPIELGRSNKADMQINEDNASRFHTQIEHKRGRFIITDQSLNGTYVDVDNEIIHLKKNESYELTGKGRICLGVDFNKTTEIVNFKIL